jgi:hypothetical protein
VPLHFRLRSLAFEFEHYQFDKFLLPGETIGAALGSSARTWTSAASLPGGDIADANFARFFEGIKQRYTWLPNDLARRDARLWHASKQSD